MNRICCSLWFFSIFNAATAFASEESIVERREILFRPPNAALAIDLFAVSETFVIERGCFLNSPDAFEPGLLTGANSIEFGLRVPLPQKLPAQSQYYIRYNCLRPGIAP